VCDEKQWLRKEETKKQGLRVSECACVLCLLLLLLLCVFFLLVLLLLLLELLIESL
jgi:hypothetical protein